MSIYICGNQIEVSRNANKLQYKMFKCGFFKIDIVHKLKSWFAICYMSLREKFETGNIFYLIFQCWFKSSNLIVDRENDLTVNQ